MLLTSTALEGALPFALPEDVQIHAGLDDVVRDQRCINPIHAQACEVEDRRQYDAAENNAREHDLGRGACVAGAAQCATQSEFDRHHRLHNRHHNGQRD